jgi:restriction endonuclease Mrr
MVLTVSTVKAEDGQVSFGNLAAKIAERFGLNQDEVEAVISEARQAEMAQRQAEMQSNYEERLTEAVNNGQLTEEQKQLVLAKHEEIQANRQEPGEFKEMSDEDRELSKTEREQERVNLESWAEENGIDMKYLMMGDRGMRGGPGGHPMGIRPEGEMSEMDE